jgi:hypothetical protein
MNFALITYLTNFIKGRSFTRIQVVYLKSILIQCVGLPFDCFWQQPNYVSLKYRLVLNGSWIFQVQSRSYGMPLKALIASNIFPLLLSLFWTFFLRFFKKHSWDNGWSPIRSKQLFYHRQRHSEKNFPLAYGLKYFNWNTRRVGLFHI